MGASAWGIIVSLVFMVSDLSADLFRRRRIGWSIHPLIRRRNPMYWAAFPVCAAVGFLPSAGLRALGFLLGIAMYLVGIRRTRRERFAEAERALKELKCPVHDKCPSLEARRGNRPLQIVACCERSQQAGKVVVEKVYNR